MSDREFDNINGIKVCDQTARDKIPTKTSQLENDSDYVTTTQLNQAIDNAQLGGGEVDLSGYVTKETGNANQITFADGQTFQNKLDAGILKGEKGEQGIQGEKGDTGEQGPAGVKGQDGLTTSISLNGVTYTQENGVITLPNITSGGNIPSATQVEPQELDMPKVFFYGAALPTTKDNVNLTMDYISNTAKFSSFVKLKCQGTSSMSYAKKNFTVAMYSDEARTTKLKKDFKGWGAQSKFCLKANYVDTTHTRNISGARIAYDMVASRPDSPFKQQLLQCPRNGAIDGFPIKLYFNGEFYGIYTWNIPKDGWMFNMDKSNPNHVVLCAEKNTDGNSSLINSCQFRQLWTNGDGNDWSVEFGTYSTDMVAKFNRCINFVMTATDEEFKANISEYFDLYSLLDYYCFSYLCCHLDGLAKNMLMVTYDGIIWGACLYDMDSIYGAYINGISFKDANMQCPEQYQEQFSALWPRIENCFGAELYARYLELRQGALSLSNIIKHVEEIYDVIPDRVFADEKAKWTGLPQVNTNTMTRFRNYMRDRAVYVDAQMQEIGTKVPCTGIVLSADTLSFTTADTQTLEVVLSPSNTTDTVIWSVDPTNIASVDNGVVTPIANGTCTITATCGSHSDTCSVTVLLPVVECTGISLDKNTLTLDNSLTATLVPTVTPDNCTQPVVWSVSPEGIVTVNNGLVTAVANGEATVTATCGSYSDTCAVTVSSLADNNILATTTFSNGTLIVSNGNVEVDTSNYYSDYIEIADASHVSVTHTGTMKADANRLIFYDNSKKYIKGQYNRALDITSAIPTNAKYIRIAFSNTVTSTSVNFFNFDGTANEYINDSVKLETHINGTRYNEMTGAITSENGFYSMKITAPSDDNYYYLQNIASGASYDADGTFIPDTLLFAKIDCIRLYKASKNISTIGINYSSSKTPSMKLVNDIVSSGYTETYLGVDN